MTKLELLREAELKIQTAHNDARQEIFALHQKVNAAIERRRIAKEKMNILFNELRAVYEEPKENSEVKKIQKERQADVQLIRRTNNKISILEEDIKFKRNPKIQAAHAEWKKINDSLTWNDRNATATLKRQNNHGTK